MSITATQGLQWDIQAFVQHIAGFEDLRWGLGVTYDTIDVVLTGAPTGIAGALTVALITFDGSVVIQYPQTTGIEEVPANSGRYMGTVIYPDVGRYLVVWTYGDTVYVELDVVAEHRWPGAFAQERWAFHLP